MPVAFSEPNSKISLYPTFSKLQIGHKCFLQCTAFHPNIKSSRIFRFGFSYARVSFATWKAFLAADLVGNNWPAVATGASSRVTAGSARQSVLSPAPFQESPAGTSVLPPVTRSHATLSLHVRRGWVILLIMFTYSSVFNCHCGSRIRMPVSKILNPC